VVRTGQHLWARHPAVRAGSRLSAGERAADLLKRGFGTWTALGAVAAAIGAWVALQRTGARWDPYPFILLNLCLSCLAAVQGIILQISANRGDRIAAEVALHTQENTDKLVEHGGQLYEINQQQLEILQLLRDSGPGR
jgi:uncharacterized membrane protein